MTTSNSYKDYVENVQAYLAPVKERAQRYIHQKIWEDITYNQLENWLSNFKHPDEKFLSAILLDQFSIRSQFQTAALLKHAILTCLPNALHNSLTDVWSSPDYQYLLKIRHDQSHNIRFVPVIRDLDPPTKSGPSVARLYRRFIKIADCNMIWPWQIEEVTSAGVDTIVFIDDMVGTGRQFCEFVEKHVPDTSPAHTKYVYIPLLAHEQGLKYIASRTPFIMVHPVEIGDSESNFFDRPITRHIHDLRDLYMEVAKRHLNHRFFNQMALGYDGLAMTISYAHATPNATLPLYWYESPNFYPLVSR